ncbi:Dimethylaniline monooxygenase [N-oxide-forming] 5 [Araneus ventricosus]|uniref:Flavin-containing monooxygenase n=1 Tax=Araneus ventricosus TaxID=182803 RepID=A0A4Y2AN19_ARAVE|nr:Dimethylaniline monooxygenase [N-oxide-forming] 5 [Araneus ventricosus]
MRRIAVIGAGTSGLTAIKCCREEGMDVTCFEKTENFGGRWRFRKHSIPGLASVTKSTVSLHSKEMIAFSDFPPPKSYPNYMHHTKMLEYLQMYAEHFDLLSHIQYRKEVVQVFPVKDFDTSGKWLLKIVDLKTGQMNEQEFDGVMICTGRLSQAYIPTTPNRENFRGKVLHTQSLKTTEEFENLNVLIIGSGNSAMDAAVDISTLAKQVYLSTRSGTWILPKVGPKGLPFDMVLLRRHFHILKRYFNNSMNSFLEKYLEKKIQHEAYNLKPNHRVLDAPLVMNDIIPDKILTGRVHIKGIIKKFEENAVVFEGEKNAEEIDVVIFATGYEMKMPLLDDKFYKTDQGQSTLYKRVFSLGLKHSTLAVIGFVECQGPISTIAESQSRWAARILSGKLKLPREDILKERMQMKVSVMEDYMEYMNELAEEYGAKPDMSTFLFKDFYLYWLCLTGPFVSYQYRLSGPHKWDDARKAIFECYDRVTWPLSTARRYSLSKRKNEEEKCLRQIF